MGRIRRLDEDTIAKIAAGEVVEGPGSVVKELVENALDAGARRIEVTLREGGRDSITVTDDGGGMEADEVELAFQRHATSKIATAGDLVEVATLGFRGEALAVIAAVSRVTLVTRPPAAEAGTVIRLEGGRVLAVTVAGCPPGTTVTVEDLFFNLPPRHKSLRAAGAETARVADTLTRLIYARPEVAFRLRSGDRGILSSPGTGRALDALVAVSGIAVATRMLAVDQPPVTGFLGGPDLHSRARAALITVVNGRPVRDRVVAAAVEEAYRTVLPVGRYPVGVIWLDLPRAEVDVNVHPAKLTVAHHNPQRLRREVSRAVAAALGGLPVSRPLWTSPAPRLAEEAAAYGRPVQPAMWGDGPGETEGESWDFRVIGQAHQSYLVLEGADGVYLVDQHAAHERITYEQLAGSPDPGPGTQWLLTPVVVAMRPGEWEAWSRRRPLLEAAGFALEEFGGDSLLVRGVPAPVADVAAAGFVRRVMEETGDGDADRLCQVMAACRASLKARQALSAEEMGALVQQLGAARRPYTCAHGRPTLLRMGLDELKRRFGRT